eukprot:TRINITY_DN38356_c0_g1_i1.p1 TRINITY_DN38356_c0_g1~~TRINITY_DN38356_c0_g1_i1.p1  ORF type:complete len:904 (+),score=270.65 TRINITY_DN38356_c0_g1_i1:360-2714(+)
MEIDPYADSGPFHTPPEAAVPRAEEPSPASRPQKHRRSRREQSAEGEHFPVESNDDRNSGDTEDSTSEGRWQKGADSSASSAASDSSSHEKMTTREVRQQVNGSTPAGYIQLGTPPKKLYVILDTGSDKLVAKTWDTIRRELRMVDGGIDGAVLPSDSVYNHQSSTSYVHLIADAKDKRAAPLLNGGGKAHSQKRGFIAYGSGVAITDEGLDTVSVGGRLLPSFPLSEITADSLSMLHTKQGISGILGLQHMKNNTLGESVFTRARKHGGMYSFGYCRGNDNDGTFIWGDQAKDGHKLPVIGQIHWALKLEKVKMIGGTSHKAKSSESESSSSTRAEFESPSAKREDEAASSNAGDVFPMPHRVADRWEPSSLAQVEQPAEESEATTAAGSSGVDPETKKEIGKMVTDVIDKVIDKIQHRKGSDAVTAMTETSKEACGNGKCTAIIDTGSNIIAGPSSALRELAKFANVKYDCSNLEKLPNIHLMLGDFKVSLPPKAYVMQVKLPKWAQIGAGGHGGGGGGGGGEGGQDSGGEAAGLGEAASALHKVSSSENATETLAPAARGWKALIKELHESYGVDLSAALHDQNLGRMAGTDKLCMPAFAPLDKETAVGKLWVIGTPIFEQYYARWSYPKDAEHPFIYFKDKTTAQACQKGAGSGSDTAAASTSADEDAAGTTSTTAEPAASNGSGADGFTAAANTDQATRSTQQVLHTLSADISPRLLRQDDPRQSLQLLDEGSVDADGDASSAASSMRREEAQSRSFIPRQLDIFDIRYPHWAKQLSDV